MDKVKKPFYKKWWFIAIVVLFVIGGIGSALESDETKQKREDEKVAAEQKKEDDKVKKVEVAAVKEKDKEDVEAPLSIEEKVEQIVTDKIGKTTNMEKDRIVELRVPLLEAEEDGKKNIVITLNASENVSNDMTRRKMWMDSVEILEPLSKIDGVENILLEWMFPFSDKLGNIEDRRIMMFSFPKEVFEKVNWDNFNVENLPEVAVEYFEHPALNK